MINNDDNLIYVDEINEVKAIKVIKKVFIGRVKTKKLNLLGGGCVELY